MSRMIPLALVLVLPTAAAAQPRGPAVAMKVALDGDTAVVTVAFNYTGKAGDPPTFQDVRMYTYRLPVGAGPTRVGWEGTEGKQSVVMAGKRHTYYPANTDRRENGTLAVTRAAGGKLRLTGVYNYQDTLFVVDETLAPGHPVLLEARGGVAGGGLTHFSRARPRPGGVS